MQQFAILIDLGYLKFTFSEVLNQEHINISSNLESLCSFLVSHAEKHAPGRLLRIYFYDWAVPNTPLREEHSNIAKCRNAYLRLGQLRKNEDGSYRQKGVDGLIVTDLMALSQNRAISDAFLVSWDEDLAIGISSAKWMGIRVHLMNVPTKKPTVSPHLIEESDSQIMLPSAEIKWIMKSSVHVAVVEDVKDGVIHSEMDTFSSTLTPEELDSIKTSKSSMISSEIDRKMMGFMRASGKFWNPIPSEYLKNARRYLVSKLKAQ